jgi:hypothetical protein
MIDELTPNSVASLLIDKWHDIYNRQMPWVKVVEIVVIVAHLSDSDKARLLNLGDPPPPPAPAQEGPLSTDGDPLAHNSAQLRIKDWSQL